MESVRGLIRKYRNAYQLRPLKRSRNARAWLTSIAAIVRRSLGYTTKSFVLHLGGNEARTSFLKEGLEALDALGTCEDARGGMALDPKSHCKGCFG
jgi:hypothetical protein